MRGRAIAKQGAMNAKKRGFSTQKPKCAPKTAPDSAGLGHRVRFVGKIDFAGFQRIRPVLAKHRHHYFPIVNCIKVDMAPRFSVASVVKGGKSPMGSASKVAREKKVRGIVLESKIARRKCTAMSVLANCAFKGKQPSTVWSMSRDSRFQR
jgi:hypothetical protein